MKIKEEEERKKTALICVFFILLIYEHDEYEKRISPTRIPPKYEKLSDQFVYWVIDVLLH